MFKQKSFALQKLSGPGRLSMQDIQVDNLLVINYHVHGMNDQIDALAIEKEMQYVLQKNHQRIHFSTFYSNSWRPASFTRNTVDFLSYVYPSISPLEKNLYFLLPVFSNWDLPIPLTNITISKRYRMA